MKKKKGLLIVISGPSGIGKSTIRERLVKENDDFWYSISMTTRRPRKIEKTNMYEQDGVDYYFVDEDDFVKNIKEDNFLEYAEVYKGLYYGTLKDIVFKKLDEGINVILEIDVNGAKQVRKNYKNALLIFLRPRSLEELEYRLRNRRTDSDEAIKERLNKAIYEISNSGIYDYVIESGSKEEDYEKVKNIIEYEKKQEYDDSIYTINFGDEGQKEGYMGLDVPIPTDYVLFEKLLREGNDYYDKERGTVIEGVKPSFVIIKMGATYTSLADGLNENRFANISQDNVKELADLCEQYEIPFGFYYFSQALTTDEADKEARLNGVDFEDASRHGER